MRKLDHVLKSSGFAGGLEQWPWIERIFAGVVSWYQQVSKRTLFDPNLNGSNHSSAATFGSMVGSLLLTLCVTVVHKQAPSTSWKFGSDLRALISRGFDVSFRSTDDDPCLGAIDRTVVPVWFQDETQPVSPDAQIWVFGVGRGPLRLLHFLTPYLLLQCWCKFWRLTRSACNSTAYSYPCSTVRCWHVNVNALETLILWDEDVKNGTIFVVPGICLMIPDPSKDLGSANYLQYGAVLLPRPSQTALLWVRKHMVAHGTTWRIAAGQMFHCTNLWSVVSWRCDFFLIHFKSGGLKRNKVDCSTKSFSSACGDCLMRFWNAFQLLLLSFASSIHLLKNVRAREHHVFRLSLWERVCPTHRQQIGVMGLHLVPWKPLHSLELDICFAPSDFRSWWCRWTWSRRWSCLENSQVRCFISNMNHCSLCSICNDVSPGHTCHPIRIVFPVLSLLFLQLSLFHTCFCFLFTPKKTWSTGPAQKTESEMIPIGSWSSRWFFLSPSEKHSSGNLSSSRKINGSLSCSCSRILSVTMFRLSGVFENEQFWQSLMQVSTDLLIWTDTHMQSRSKVLHVAVLTGKFVKFNFPNVFFIE